MRGSGSGGSGSESDSVSEDGSSSGDEEDLIAQLEAKEAELNAAVERLKQVAARAATEQAQQEASGPEDSAGTQATTPIDAQGKGGGGAPSKGPLGFPPQVWGLGAMVLAALCMVMGDIGLELHAVGLEMRGLGLGSDPIFAIARAASNRNPRVFFDLAIGDGEQQSTGV